MRKGNWSAAAIVVLLAVGIVVAGGAEVRAADTRVAMGSSNEPLAFIPADITVPVGGSVEWFNDTEVEHDVQAEDGSFGTPGSDLLGKGEKYEFKFSKAGTFKYFCTPHKSTGMVGTVTVGASTPSTAATTTTAAPAAGASTTTTTAKGAQASSTTTTTAAAAGASTTTTTAAGAAVTSTTLGQPTTPTSAPETGGVTTTTAAGTGAHGEEAAAGEHGSSGNEDTNAPGVAFAGVLTLILGSISVKMLLAKT